MRNFDRCLTPTYHFAQDEARDSFQPRSECAMNFTHERGRPYRSFGSESELDASEHTSESVLMPITTPHQPTLWRTCRTIANRTRLDMFALLVQTPGLTVSAVARHLGQPLSLTSEYLRALESRGLLRSRRVGRRVEYRSGPTTSEEPIADLVTAIRKSFQKDSSAVETIFRLATAFTHPRRVEIYRALQIGPQTLEQLRTTTRISRWAALRHLSKMQARDFVTCREGLYAVVNRQDSLGGELARMAAI